MIHLLAAACLPLFTPIQSTDGEEYRPPKIAIPKEPSRVDWVIYYMDKAIKEPTDQWFTDGEYTASVQLLKLRYEISPFHYDALTDLGWMLENMTQWNDAEGYYTRYIDEYPEYIDSSLPLGQFYLFRKNYQKVIDTLEPQLKRKPHANQYRILARAYDLLQKPVDALRVYRELISQYPDDAQAKVNAERMEKKIRDLGGE